MVVDSEDSAAVAEAMEGVEAAETAGNREVVARQVVVMAAAVVMVVEERVD